MQNEKQGMQKRADQGKCYQQGWQIATLELTILYKVIAIAGGIVSKLA